MLICHQDSIVRQQRFSIRRLLQTRRAYPGQRQVIRKEKKHFDAVLCDCPEIEHPSTISHFMCTFETGHPLAKG